MPNGESIAGYSHGKAEAGEWHVSLADLERVTVSAGFTERDWQSLRLAGEVLADQTEAIVNQWRSGFIAGIPHLALHSRTPEGDPIPEYLAKSNLRFQQWIMDTCTKPYDQDWLNYQQEIALRHTTVKKNRTDGVRSTPYMPLSDIVAFVAAMNETPNPISPRKATRSKMSRGCIWRGASRCSCRWRCVETYIDAVSGPAKKGICFAAHFDPCLSFRVPSKDVYGREGPGPHGIDQCRHRLWQCKEQAVGEDA